MLKELNSSPPLTLRPLELSLSAVAKLSSRVVFPVLLPLPLPLPMLAFFANNAVDRFSIMSIAAASVSVML